MVVGTSKSTVYQIKAVEKVSCRDLAAFRLGTSDSAHRSSRTDVKGGKRSFAVLRATIRVADGAVVLRECSVSTWRCSKPDEEDGKAAIHRNTNL